MEIRRAAVTQQKSMLPPNDRGWYRIFESFAGAWQSNVTIDRDTVLSYSAVYACVTLIAQDIGKLRIKLVAQKPNGLWEETQSPAYSDLLRKPNHYQTRIKFLEQWITSKLLHGNAYVLKVRDARGNVVAMYVLDPMRVLPLVADDGSVFYELKDDRMADIRQQIIIPAREIIHDPMVTLFHPLVGVTPIYACGLAAMQGVNIQRNSSRFFANQSQPGGILTAPGSIGDDTAARLKAYWEENFTGENAGRVAVVGDDLKYERLTVNAVDAQLIEQLKFSAETVCSCFHVPPYMIGTGPMPAYNNIEALNQQYYSQCLQSLIESQELSLDEGLLLPPALGTELDLDGLLRMDTATRFKSHSDAIAGGWLSPNEARRKEDYAPVTGGDTPYMQQQNYALGALYARDTKEVTNDTNIQASVMNGAQVAALQALIVAAAAGEIPAESARATISAAFPLLTPAQVSAMITPLASFEQTPTPTPASTPPPPAADPPSSEDQGNAAKELLEYLTRAFDEALAA